MFYLHEFPFQAITLLLALHVSQIAPKAARALPRYSDIIVADIGEFLFERRKEQNCPFLYFFYFSVS